MFFLALITAGLVLVSCSQTSGTEPADSTLDNEGKISFQELSVSYNPQTKTLEVFASFPEGKISEGTFFVFVEEDDTGYIVERYTDALSSKDIRTAAKCTHEFCGTLDSVSRTYDAELDPSKDYTARVVLLGKEKGAFMGKENVFMQP